MLTALAPGGPACAPVSSDGKLFIQTLQILKTFCRNAVEVASIGRVLRQNRPVALSPDKAVDERHCRVALPALVRAPELGVRGWALREGACPATLDEQQAGPVYVKVKSTGQALVRMCTSYTLGL